MAAIARSRTITVPDVRARKPSQRNTDDPLVALTAYDFTIARLLDRAGVDILLVGDSLGMVVQGESTTLPVTLEQMIYHTRCVARAVERALVVADMPFLSTAGAAKSVVGLPRAKNFFLAGCSPGGVSELSTCGG
jgi:3-methyl-2-oxobutanoate hydroxymethyltransferase